MKKYDIAIIGAGASGMFAAIQLKELGKKVLLLDSNDIVGKKILATGNGKCNFTNDNQEAACYRSDCPKQAWEIVSTISAQTVCEEMEKLGIHGKERKGYWYPYSEQASAVRELLEYALKSENIEISLNCRVEEVLRENNSFRIQCFKRDILQEAGEYKEKGKVKKRKAVFSEEYEKTYLADRIILATGGKAGNISGADGSGYRIAEELGLHVIKPVEALVQLKATGHDFSFISGVRLEAEGTLQIGADHYRERGEYLFTEYGISGIPAMQLSRYASVCLNRTADSQKREKVELILDFFPDFSQNELREMLQKRLGNNRELNRYLLLGLLPAKLEELIRKEMKTENSNKLNAEAKIQIDEVIEKLKHFRMEIIGTNSFEQAQVCAGGVDLEDLNPNTMETGKVPGLYVIGELADVDGTCGGYNLHWAWASAMITAKGMRES